MTTEFQVKKKIMQIVGLYVEDKDYKINITNRNAVNFRTYEVDYRLLIQGVRKNPDNDLMFADFLKISKAKRAKISLGILYN